MARSAVWYEREARWDTALETYQLAIQQLMTAAKQSVPEERRILTAAVCIPIQALCDAGSDWAGLPAKGRKNVCFI